MNVSVILWIKDNHGRRWLKKYVLMVESNPWTLLSRSVTIVRAASLWRFSTTATLATGLATQELANKPVRAKRLKNEVFILNVLGEIGMKMMESLKLRLIE